MKPSPEKKKAVGALIRANRESAGFSQEQIAGALGIDRSTYSCYERGTTAVSLDTIDTLARIFGISRSALIPPSMEITETPLLDSGIDLSKVPENTTVNKLTVRERFLIAIYRAADLKQRGSILKRAYAVLYKKKPSEKE